MSEILISPVMARKDGTETSNRLLFGNDSKPDFKQVLKNASRELRLNAQRKQPNPEKPDYAPKHKSGLVSPIRQTVESELKSDETSRETNDQKLEILLEEEKPETSSDGFPQLSADILMAFQSLFGGETGKIGEFPGKLDGQAVLSCEVIEALTSKLSAVDKGSQGADYLPGKIPDQLMQMIQMPQPLESSELNSNDTARMLGSKPVSTSESNANVYPTAELEQIDSAINDLPTSFESEVIINQALGAIGPLTESTGQNNNEVIQNDLRNQQAQNNETVNPGQSMLTENAIPANTAQEQYGNGYQASVSAGPVMAQVGVAQVKQVDPQRNNPVYVAPLMSGNLSPEMDQSPKDGELILNLNNANDVTDVLANVKELKKSEPKNSKDLLRFNRLLNSDAALSQASPLENAAAPVKINFPPIGLFHNFGQSFNGTELIKTPDTSVSDCSIADQTDTTSTKTGMELTPLGMNSAEKPFLVRLEEASSSGKTMGSPNVNKQEVIEQIVEKAKVMINHGSTEMEISLKPDSLGKIQLRVALENQAITAQFVAESDQVKRILESSMVDLRKMLQDNGIQVQNLMVSVGHQGQGNESFTQTFNESNRHSNSRGSLNSNQHSASEAEAVVAQRGSSRSTMIDLIA